MYNNKIINIFQNPMNAGLLRGANGKGKAETDVLSDIVEIYILVENNIIQECKFKAYGGVSTIVCASVICEMAKNKSTLDVTKITESDILKEIVSLPEEKLYSLSLAVNALNDAVIDYTRRIEKEKQKK